MIRFLALAVALLIIIPFKLKGQFYTTGENPSKIRWQQISSDNFQIVYPAGLTDEAVRVATGLEYAFKNADDFSFRPGKRFPVLMQNASVLSNGFVALAPSRMELQITPPQDSYAQDWINQLSLHEFRHVSQLKKLNQGITGFLGSIFGDIPRGVVSAQIPSWFYEGDAVFNETRLSGTGRGRSAGFEMPLRTLLQDSNYRYSYDKALFGSYRDFVPDQYVYGYSLTNYIRSHYGTETWSSAINHVARNPFKIWPFAIFLRKEFGFFNNGLYNKTIDSLVVEYNKINREYSGIRTDENLQMSAIIKSRTEAYTNYLHPKLYKDMILAFRAGLSDPGSFVLIDSAGNESHLLTTGQTLLGKTDLHAGILVWDEVRNDPRWGKRDYSVIRKTDIASGKTRVLTRKTRYFSPDFSPDGSRIAVSENDAANDNYLTIIDAEKGDIIQRIPTGHKTIVTPEWSDGNNIIAVTVTKEGKQLESVNVATEKWRVLIPYTTNNICDPADYGSYILFRADFNQKENLFAIEKSTGQILQVTESITGARHPVMSDDLKYLYFSEYTVKGFNIIRQKSDPGTWKAVNPFNSNFSRSLSIPDVITTLPESYLKPAHLFRFHSWLPFYADIDEIREDPMNINIYPGFILFSQNMLGTTTSSLGYSYQNGYHHFRPAMILKGAYPVLDFSMDIGGPHRMFPLPDDVTVPDNQGPYYKLNARIYVPLSFSRGAFNIFVRPELDYEFSPVKYYSGGRVRSGIDLMHIRLFASNYRRMAIRDIYPKWGQSVSSTYSFQPTGQYFGSLFSVKLGMFFPGIGRHHNFFFAAGYQLQNSGMFFLPYIRSGFPRGYNTLLSETFSCLMLNYTFPVAYTDLSLGPIMYIKRIRSNFFYDLGMGGAGLFGLHEGADNHRFDIESFGAEMVADLHTLRIIFPLSAGIRLGYKSKENKGFAEFLLQINTDL